MQIDITIDINEILSCHVAISSSSSSKEAWCHDAILGDSVASFAIEPSHDVSINVCKV